MVFNMLFLASSISATQTTASDDLAIYDIIVIPLLVCLIPAIISIISAYVSYKYSRKSGQDKLIHDSIKQQHDLVVVPIYRNIKSADSFDSIKKTNDEIVKNNANILTPLFNQTFYNIRSVSQTTYIQAVEMLYDYTTNILKHNSIDKAFSKVKKLIIEEEKRNKSKNNRFNIFKTLFNFINDLLNSGYYKKAYELSLQKSTLRLMNDSLESQSGIDNENFNNIMTAYKDKKSSDKFITFERNKKKTEVISTIIKNSLVVADFIPYVSPLVSSLSIVDELLDKKKKKDEWIMLTDKKTSEVSNDDIQEIWANILASELTKSVQIHPRMVEVVKLMSPDDATLFAKIASSDGRLTWDNNGVDEKTLFAIENLAYFGIINKSQSEKRFTCELTLFGKKFANIVFA